MELLSFFRDLQFNKSITGIL
jgi:hypothetical protein